MSESFVLSYTYLLCVVSCPRSGIRERKERARQKQKKKGGLRLDPQTQLLLLLPPSFLSSHPQHATYTRARLPSCDSESELNLVDLAAHEIGEFREDSIRQNDDYCHADCA